MRDQRGIVLGVGDAIMDTRTGLEYEVIEVQTCKGGASPHIRLHLKTNFMFPLQPHQKIDDVAINDFIKVPRLDESMRTEKVLEMSGGRKQ